MAPEPLQALTTIQAVILLSQILISLLGLTVAYIAYVGFRRHEREPMLYFCVGFFLLFGPPAIVGIAVLVGIGSEVGGSLVTALSKIVGLVLVLAALRING
jgi:hypothetical protein